MGGRASRNGQVRDGHARSTARKRVYRHLTRAFNEGAQTGHPSGCDQPQVVTAPGHRRGVHCELTQNRGYFVGGLAGLNPKLLLVRSC